MAGWHHHSRCPTECLTIWKYGGTTRTSPRIHEDVPRVFSLLIYIDLRRPWEVRCRHSKDTLLAVVKTIQWPHEVDHHACQHLSLGFRKAQCSSHKGLPIRVGIWTSALGWLSLLFQELPLRKLYLAQLGLYFFHLPFAGNNGVMNLPSRCIISPWLIKRCFPTCYWLWNVIMISYNSHNGSVLNKILAKTISVSEHVLNKTPGILGTREGVMKNDI